MPKTFIVDDEYHETRLDKWFKQKVINLPHSLIEKIIRQNKIRLNKKKVSNSQIILYGESLGTGVAVEIASKNNFNSIILESPFTSIENSAKIYYPYLPIKLLLKDRYDSISKIGTIKTPILIMHGEKDDITPFSMGKELLDKANHPKHSYFTSNDDHMMEFNDQLLTEIKKFVEKY